MPRRARSLPLTELRSRLSPVVHDIERLGAVAVTVRGEVRAWLVSPKRFEASGSAEVNRPRPIRGTLTLCGDLEAGSAQAAEAWVAMAGTRP